MPPFGFRKRERSPSPAASSQQKTKKETAAKATSKKGKSILFHTADTPTKKHRTVEDNRKFLDDLDNDEESSLSEVESDDFEDVPRAKRRKTSAAVAAGAEENGEDDEMVWEDAIQPESSSHPTRNVPKPDEEIGDISISLNDDGSYIEPIVSGTSIKKGPSKRERQIRVQTHCLHVQALMWQNTVRNSWLNDKEVQKVLVNGLPEGVKREVQKWKDVMSRTNKEESKEQKQKISPKGKGKGKRGKKSGRDWNVAAETQYIDTTHATNTLLRLLKVLTAYWRKRFTVTTPSLRKQGYKDLRRLRNEIKAWEKDWKDEEEHGERIESVEDLRKLAKKCEGSRDVGGQLFVALLRGLGLETRMVANLQPAGFGWSKAEDADVKKEKGKKRDDMVELVDSDSEEDVKVAKPTKSKTSTIQKKTNQNLKGENPLRKSTRGNKADPIDLDDSESPLSEPPSETGGAEEDDDDDLSVVDITPSIPKKKPHKKYDRDLAFPNYWTEVCDPTSHKYYPIDPIVLSTIASNDELLQTFEPRGKKAEKAKQVICYTIAYSSDGTAKDVTVRYLKRHQLPGKTKGMRMPVEKVPIYNRKGKVRRYEEYDWFRTLISLYDRPESKRIAADDLEDATDLKPFKPSKEEKVVEKESLQGYKQSAEFVLEQHLRREEALLPGSQSVKTFITGKGDKEKEFDVHLRSNIVICRTVESWHKEGRAIKMGEQPVKYVPMRAVTLIKKREMEDAERETGEKLKQGLYSQSQTEWIIPPPIRDGVIPKNAFGNMDVYVPTMVPKGAVHLPLKGSAKLCRRLEIDYSEACTGFEFGKQRAVPVLTGVVVAKEHERLVRDAWRTEQEEVKRKEDTKRTATALHWWRKMLLGLRVLERMRVEYAVAGGEEDEINPFVAKARREGRIVESAGTGARDENEVQGGGFFPEGHDEEEALQQKTHHDDDDDGGGGGFLMDEDGDNDVDGGAAGGFLVEENIGEAAAKNHALITPVSLQSMHRTVDDAAKSDSEATTKTNIVRKPNVSSMKARKQPQSKANGTKPKRRKPVILSDGEESSLSDLSDSVDNDSDANESDAVPTPPRSKKSNPRSPRVVISPQKKSTQNSVQKNATPNGVRKKTTRASKKVTPVRSQYFDHSDKELDEEDDDEASDAEVVKVRATTTRTRAKA